VLGSSEFAIWDFGLGIEDGGLLKIGD
jgi:hypothetical protein